MSSSSTECASGDSRWQPHPSQWIAPPTGQQPVDPWHSMNPDFMHTYQTWNPQQQQQHSNAQYQGWGQQLQPIHHGAQAIQRPVPRQALPIPRPDQSPANSDIVSQAMRVINMPHDTSVQLDVSLGSSLNDSSFLKRLGSLPVTPQEKKRKQLVLTMVTSTLPPPLQRRSNFHSQERNPTSCLRLCLVLCQSHCVLCGFCYCAKMLLPQLFVFNIVIFYML